MIAIKDLEEFFKENEVGTDPIKLDGVTTIHSPREFVDGHLKFVKNNRGELQKPYMERLIKLRTIIQNNGDGKTGDLHTQGKREIDPCKPGDIKGSD